LSYQSFLKVAGEPSCAKSELVMSYSSLPPIGDIGNLGISEVPSLEELGYKDDEQVRGDLFSLGRLTIYPSENLMLM